LYLSDGSQTLHTIPRPISSLVTKETQFGTFVNLCPPGSILPFFSQQAGR
jgi:hypothetical protein